MKKTLQKGELYKITWHDIHHDNLWKEYNDIYDIPETMTNVWTYVDEIDCFYIFTSGGDSGQYFDNIKVPKGCIIDYERLS